MAELKPCPFCGGEAGVMYIPGFKHPKTGRLGIDRFQVYCDGCGCVTAAMLSEEDAREAWNRRANE